MTQRSSQKPIGIGRIAGWGRVASPGKTVFRHIAAGAKLFRLLALEGKEFSK